METSTAEQQPHASLEDDMEFTVLKSAVLNGTTGRPLSRWDTPICESCRRGDAVTSTSRRNADITVKRHSCERCELHGATVIITRVGSEPAMMHTAGDVQTIDLEAEENADARGTC